MFPVLSKAAVSILAIAATLTNPATPDSLPFGASAYVTVNNQIRVSVQKNPDIPVVILLRNKDNQVLFRQHVSKRDLSTGQKWYKVSNMPAIKNSIAQFIQAVTE